MLELKDYINQTIRQIIDGVKEANSYAVENGAEVNTSSIWSTLPSNLLKGTDNSLIQVINFEIVINVAESDSAQGGAGIFIGPVSLGSKISSSSADNAQNKISFSLPVRLPQSQYKSVKYT